MDRIACYRDENGINGVEGATCNPMLGQVANVSRRGEEERVASEQGFKMAKDVAQLVLIKRIPEFQEVEIVWQRFRERERERANYKYSTNL